MLTLCRFQVMLTAAIFFFCTPLSSFEAMAGIGIRAIITASPTKALQPRIEYKNPGVVVSGTPGRVEG
jgi:uncharacterized SAM-binding protein YcdF (DUF218 family)